jgi:hypothetical protein
MASQPASDVTTSDETTRQSEQRNRRGGRAAPVGLAASMMVSACMFGSPNARTAAGILPRAPAEVGRCHVAAGLSSPLVTEWPASEKANLEVLLTAGAVAVAYSGCSMRVLADCRVRGVYRWTRTTPSTDSLEINDADELFAKLPLGAASLEGELKRSGKLSVQTMVAGQLRLDDGNVADIPKEGPCAQATHVVSALSLGAFALKAGGTGKAEAGITVATVGTGIKHEKSADLLRSAGDFDTCSTGTDQGPAANCASPIQAFLTAIPGRAEEDGPPGTLKVDFVSSNASSRWDVYADDRVICTTPCAQWVSAEHPIMLRAREEAFGGKPDRVQVPNLLAHAGEGRVQLQAHPTARGELATGITFTALSGLGVITGVALGSVGCLAGKGDGLCNAGLISLGAGLPLLAGSIWLITDAMPKAEVIPPDGGLLFVDARGARPHVVWGPGVVSGTF